MKDIKIKLKYIFIPYLLIAIGTISIYTLLRNFFDYKLDILNFKSGINDLLFPTFFVAISLFIFFRKRVRIIYSERFTRGNGIYPVTAAVIILIPVLLFQGYLKDSASVLHEIKDVNKINNSKKTDCYKIQEFNVNKNNAGVYRETTTYDGKDKKIEFRNYFAVPIVNKAFNFNSVNHKYWFGIHYINSISSQVSDSVKNKLCKEFYKECINNFEHYNFSDFQYLKVMENSGYRDCYVSAIINRQPNVDKSAIIIFEPEKKNFEERFGFINPFLIFCSFLIGAFIFLLMILIKSINKKEYQIFISKKNKLQN